MQNRSTLRAGASSSARSLRPQQTPPEERYERYANTTIDLRNITGYDSELGHLLSPPSPPPSLDQIFSTEPNNSSSQRPIATSSSNNHYQNIYDSIERELLAEPSSSLQQPNTGAIPTPHSNSRYQNLYDGSQALSTAPSSSRQQAAANESASATTSQNSRCRGVSYNSSKSKWYARWVDPTQGNRRVFIGAFNTQNEAINALNSYKASRSDFFSQATNPPGLYRTDSGKWTAKYTDQGAQVRVGTFDTKEEAERALRENRAARGLPRAMASRRTG